MCLIMTIITACILSSIFIMQHNKGTVKKSLATTLLMFWAAAIMWCVDSITCVTQGEPFFDISKEDSILGVIVVAIGLAVFAILSLLEKRKLSK